MDCVTYELLFPNQCRKKPKNWLMKTGKKDQVNNEETLKLFNCCNYAKSDNIRVVLNFETQENLNLPFPQKLHSKQLLHHHT